VSSVPDDLRYSKEHEWVRVDGDTAVVGITAFAQEQLGDVVFVELPEKGARVRQHSSLGVVESVKAASDLYAPMAGTISAVNDKLTTNPELVNSDPYGDGWILKLQFTGEVPPELMDEETYKKMAEGTSH